MLYIRSVSCLHYNSNVCLKSKLVKCHRQDSNKLHNIIIEYCRAFKIEDATKMTLSRSPAIYRNACRSAYSVEFVYKKILLSTIDCFHLYSQANQNYNKILKHDWLSAAQFEH